MAVQSLEATFRGVGAVRASPIIVRTRKELAEALSQRERVVIIEDETMARIVGVFERDRNGAFRQPSSPTLYLRPIKSSSRARSGKRVGPSKTSSF
jgi:hypothetical protein